MKVQQFLLAVVVVAAVLCAFALDDVGLDLPPGVVTQAKWFPAADVPSLLPAVADVNENEVELEPAPAIAKAPAAPAAAEKPKPVLRAARKAPPTRVVVEARRTDGDARLRAAAMKAIERTPRLSGRIGVEARQSVVRLSGWTATTAQKERAGRAVSRLAGVRGVVNEIRPRVGVVSS